jgi:hypothetical protein
MAKKDLCVLIIDVFGKYSTPRHVEGFPRESWQDILEKTPLEQIDLNDIYMAMYHIYPDHYGDINVFRYLLNRTLPYFVSYFEAQDEVTNDDLNEFIVDDDDWWDGNSENDKIQEIIQITGKRCAQWKMHLEQDEIAVIDKVFKYAAMGNYYKEQKISSFFFSLLLLWVKDCEELFSYIESNYDKEIVDILREEGRKVICFFENIPNMSPLFAILGIYDDKTTGKERDEFITSWFVDSISLLRKDIFDCFSMVDIKKADKLIECFFVEPGNSQHLL